MQNKNALLAAAIIALLFSAFTGLFIEPKADEPPFTNDYRVLVTAVAFAMAFIPLAALFLIIIFAIQFLNLSLGGRSKGYDRLLAWIETKYGPMPQNDTATPMNLNDFMQNVVQKEKDKHGNDKIKGLKNYVDQRKYIGLLKK